MPHLKDEETPETQAAIVTLERRADECYELLRLLKRPRNVAMWALLTAMARELEIIQQKYGSASSKHRDARINIERHMCGFHFIALHAKPESKLVPYKFTSQVAEDALFACNICGYYTHYLHMFPLWHKNHERTEFTPDGRLRFFPPHDSTRQRQVIAYQQKHRPEDFVKEQLARNNASTTAKNLLNDLFSQARQNDRLDKDFSYEPSRELVDALRPEYAQRLDHNFRHPADFMLNGYTLGDFKKVYVELLILSAIHEYICYPFDAPGRPIPVSSLVLVKTRSEWVNAFSKTSGVSAGVCEAIVKDLMLRPESKSFTSLCITPFIPLDTSGWTLAVAPQFPLTSAVDENILRQFSYTFPALFSGQNIHKEEAMRELLRSVKQPDWGMQFSVPLPDGTTEIDVVIEDQTSSTVVLGEMKWIRKPYRPLEVLEREAEVSKGIRQLKLIQSYARTKSDDLHRRGKLSRDLKNYKHVYLVLLVRDFWYWIDPNDGIALLDFDEAITQLREGTPLNETMDALLAYEWLPTEDKDFHVKYRPSPVNGVCIESPTFHTGKPE